MGSAEEEGWGWAVAAGETGWEARAAAGWGSAVAEAMEEVGIAAGLATVDWVALVAAGLGWAAAEDWGLVEG